jgi:hypothetical protein
MRRLEASRPVSESRVSFRSRRNPAAWSPSSRATSREWRTSAEAKPLANHLPMKASALQRS